MSQTCLMLGTKIKQICEERGISVRQLERDSGLSERTINRWDTNSPAIDKVVAVSQTLGIPLDELVKLESAASAKTNNPATQSDGTISKRDEFIRDVDHMTEEEVAALSLIAKTLVTGR